MVKRWLGLLSALTMVGALGTVVACGSSSDSGGGGGGGGDSGTADTGGKTDAGGDAKDTGTPSSDSGTPSETGPDPVETGPAPTDTPTDDKTVGKKCESTDDCDVTGKGSNFCTTDASGGTLYPDALCIGQDCDPGDGSKIESCDGDLGICLSTGDSGICLGFCEFDDKGVKGCNGDKTGCNVYGWGKGDDGKVVGVGYCWGGCTSDADCKGGSKCDEADGLCLKKPDNDGYTLKVGDACTKADAEAKPPKCSCLGAFGKAEKGYCSQFCKVGDPKACEGLAGFVCESMLPKTDDKDGSALFADQPKGISGNCMKECATDDDCKALNGYCDTNLASGKKVCMPGTKE